MLGNLSAQSTTRSQQAIPHLNDESRRRWVKNRSLTFLTPLIASKFALGTPSERTSEAAIGRRSQVQNL